MKTITLHGPALRNNGQHVDAGATVAVGDKPNEINSFRAKKLVDGDRAIDSTPAAVSAPAKS